METGEKIVLWILGIIMFAVLFSVGISLVGLHIETNNGEHTGYITAVEKSGVVFKTYTVYVKTDTQSSQEDMYCVIDDRIIPELKEKSAKKEQVTVVFMDYFSAGVSNCGSYNAGIITGLK